MRIGNSMILGASQAGFQTYVPGNLTSWKAKLAQVQAGTSQALVLAVGASATRGTGSTNVGNGNNPINLASYPTQMINSLISDGLPFMENGVVGGDLGTGGTDSRVTMGADWARTGGFASLGGSTFLGANTGTTNLSITPPNAFDTIKIWYVRNASNGTFSYNIDGGAALNTVDAGGTVAVLSTTATVALGTHTINIQRTGGGTFPTGGVRIMMIDAWDSTTTKARLINCGKLSTTMAGLVSTTNGGTENAAFGTQASIAAIAPDLVILAIGGNDADNLTNITTMQTCLNSFIGTCGVGKIIVSSHTPVNVDDATRRTYTDALKATSIANNVPFIDMTALMGSYTFANGQGWMFNTLHPNSTGYGITSGYTKPVVVS